MKKVLAMILVLGANTAFGETLSCSLSVYNDGSKTKLVTQPVVQKLNSSNPTQPYAMIETDVDLGTFNTSDFSAKVFELPSFPGKSSTYVVHLNVSDKTSGSYISTSRDIAVLDSLDWTQAQNDIEISAKQAGYDDDSIPTAIAGVINCELIKDLSPAPAPTPTPDPTPAAIDSSPSPSN